ncbi:MAG TPA: succinylglutamate desuccinylase/aspartoacylase family protein [Candidatus Acidoferrales bacterium]|nr:succinylglutamate desuccinylase/aspartoacylase family protein [Candidatus Acidoferrales bacterium]
MPDPVLRVGALSAARGEKVYGVNEFPVEGQPYRLPMWLINGAHDGPSLVVTAGVHAAEYASIAAALELGRSLLPHDLHGRVIVVPVMSMPAFTARSIYICPLDGRNLNRVFPGNAHGTASEQIADWVFRNVISQATYYADLHGGDLIEALVPFTIFFRSGNERVDQVSLEIAKVFGIHFLVCSETPGSTFCAASRAGIPSILAESGGQGIWTPEHVADHTRGLNRLMRHLGMIPGGEPEPAPFTLLDKFLWLRSDHTAFWYPAVAVNEKVKAGQTLGCVKDYEGRVLQTAISPADGVVLFIVTSLAINQTDPLLAVGA